MEEKNKGSLFAQGKDEESEAMDKENGLISIPDSHLAYSLEAEVARLEKNITLFNRIKVASLKLTKPADWADMGGSPYLMERGAENIAIAWGLDITHDAPVMEWAEDDKGRYYLFEVKGQAVSRKLGRVVEDIGTCSQRDKFFGMVGGKFKEVHEVDMTSVRKKAVTNLYGRLIKRCCGLTNMTYDDLKEAGIDVSKIGKVEYRSGQKKAEKATLTPALLEKRDKIWKYAMEIAEGQEEGALAKLKEWTVFQGETGEVFAKDIKDLRTEKWINKVYGTAKKEYEETMGAPNGKAGD